MSHSIAELRSRNPMWYFERNYAALMFLLDELGVFDEGFSSYEHNGTRISITVLEETRYTYLLGICQHFPNAGKVIPDLEFKVRVYLDAQLAEVVSYQGEQYLKARYQIPNMSMFHPDEKRQSNLLLYDWLFTWGRLNFNISATCGYLI